MKFLGVRHKQELLGENRGEVEAIIRSLVTTQRVMAAADHLQRDLDPSPYSRASWAIRRR